MTFSKLTASLAAAVLSAIPLVSGSSHMIMGGLSPIAYERIDPIVNAGEVSTHVHALIGASNMNQNSDYDSNRNARCTSVPFQTVDKSVYWAPPVYYQDQNTKQLTLMPSTFNIYYFFDRNGPGEKVNAFPAGLKMVAGSPTRTTYNASSFADQAVSFVCLDYSGAVSNNPAYAERQDINFPDINACEDGIRYQIFFPQCWDGQNLDSADHKSHMAYPVDNYNGGSCPSSHPVHTVGIFYEMIIPTSNFNYWGEGAYVLSTGDPTGLAFHADFLNGWDVSMLQSAVDNCHNMNGDINACQVLAPYIDQAQAGACTVDSVVVNENVGLDGAELSALPGCNPIKTPGASTACPSSSAPSFVQAVQSVTTGWGEIGCIAEGTDGRALTGASTTSPNMTANVCVGFCASKGFTYAGTEFGDECYCGNSFSNGASANTVAWEQCNTRCAGNPLYENCGGPQRLTLLQAGAPNSSPATPSTLSVPAPASSSAAAVSSSVAISSPAVVSSAVAVSSPAVVPSSSAAAPVSISSESSAAPTSIVAVAITTSASAVGTSSTSTPVTPPAGTNSGSWTAAGCVSDGGARALTGFSFTGSDMTIEKCTSTCASKGFSMAGIEFSTECYCGNSFSNGLGAAITPNHCYMSCGGSSSETCGGTWAISLFKNSGSAPAAPVLAAPPASSSPSSAPSSWISAGCAQDGASRALTGYSFSSASMTIDTCTSTCASKGFTLAGIEFGKECYCGNSFSNGLGASIDTGRNCYMTCSGDGSEKCGGTWALSMFKASSSGASSNTASNSTSMRKRKHFGRQHYRATSF